MTSNYFAYIKVQCDLTGVYIPNGSIIFPISWDTDEKKERVMLKSAKFITDKSLTETRVNKYILPKLNFDKKELGRNL